MRGDRQISVSHRRRHPIPAPHDWVGFAGAPLESLASSRLVARRVPSATREDASDSVARRAIAAVVADTCATYFAEPDPGRRSAPESVREVVILAVSGRQRRRGFATIVALFLVGLVTAAIAVGIAGLSADGRRTRASAVDAELRQLLLAAASDAAARSAAWPADGPAGAWSVSLPPDPALAGFTLGIRVEARSAERATLTVVASGEGRRQQQRLVWTARDGHWRLAAVTLGGEGPV
jgi:hypothetical protein